jgi:hypothetical protein
VNKTTEDSVEGDSMRRTLAAVAVLSILLVGACQQKEPEPQAQNPQPPRPPAAHAAGRTGTVEEVLQANAYTYLNLKDDDGLFWVAVTKREMEVGETVSFADGLEMKNFVSKDLDRTFETVYFVSEIRTGSQPAATSTHATTSPHGKATTEKLQIALEPAPGGITIGQLFANREAYANKTVRIRGQVTKVNRAILKRNWVHLQDGTDDAGNYDLTITTNEDAEPGDIVTFEGTIVLNKDFGAGYAYEVLMEEATKQGQ